MKSEILKKVPYSKIKMDELNLIKDDVKVLIIDRRASIFKLSSQKRKKTDDDCSIKTRMILVKKR